MPARAESRDAALAVVAALLVIAGLVAGKAARDAIFLTHYAVRSLPLFVGLGAVIALPLVFVIGSVLARYGPARVVPTLHAISAVLLVGEWLLLAEAPRAGAAVVYLHLSSLGAMLISGFWSIVNERFDPRTARRLIGRIGAGATFGGIVGGLIAERCAAYLELTAILLVLAVLQLGTAALLRTLGRAPATRASVTNEPPPAALKVVAQTPLLRNLAIVVALTAIAAGCLDFVFKAHVVAEAGARGPLRFFAIYYTATNVVTALAQLVFARPILARFGIPASVATLPMTTTVLGVVAVAVPGLWSVVAARGAEMIVRSSLYRAAYELVFAPLAGAQKRATKIVIDVGAERIGDLIGAQLVGLMLYLAVSSSVLIGVSVAVSVAALAIALLVPRAYTRALEQSLLVQNPGAIPLDLGWSTVAPPGPSASRDLTALSLLDLKVLKTSAPTVTVADPRELRIDALRSGDLERVQRALREDLDEGLLPHVVPLLAWDEAATYATSALRAVAPRFTQPLVDILVDPATEFAIRRRLPAVLEVGDPALAAAGLWRAMNDQRFEVRYRCGKALARIRDAGHSLAIDEGDVVAQIARELKIERHVWQNHRLLDPAPVASQTDELIEVIAGDASRGLEHVFTLLTLILPVQPVRIAQQALYASDRTLRGTALEYLETALPDDIRPLLWPHLEPDAVHRPARPKSDRLAALTASHASVVADLESQVAGRR